MMNIGDEVGWLWTGKLTTGIVKEIHTERCEIISKNKLIVRNGTVDDPAVVILHKNGSLVLKLSHELQKLT